MNEAIVIDLLRGAFVVALKLAGPLLIVSLTVGLFISLFQAATQIQEQTLTFVPKLLIVGLSLVVLAPWMINTMRDFITEHFQNVMIFMR